MPFSIVIPSRNIRNLTACVAAIRKAGETARVICVGDGLLGTDFVTVDCLDAATDKLVIGDEPFCFARNVTKGIYAAGRDDVVISNDDALLTTPRGFSLIVDMFHGTPAIETEYGIVACSTNVTGYPGQQVRPPMLQRMFRELPVVAFVAVFIPRRTLDQIGPLDERFGGPGVYGGEDVDYCLRVRAAGLKVGVSDFCFVDHSALPSTFRAAHPGNCAPGDITESNRLGREKLGDKWPHR